MTNRERILEDIGRLSDEQLVGLLLIGVQGIPAEDFCWSVCDDCWKANGRDPERCDRCVRPEESWLRMECVRDRILEVIP